MTATTEQLLALLREARRYTKHTDDCWTHYRGEAPRGCVCGLDDVKIGIDAMLAGRVTNHPERPDSSTPHPADLLDARHETLHVEQPAHRTTPIGGDDDGN